MILAESLDRFVSETAPPHDEIQAEMAAEARERNFPIIGRPAGAFLQTVAKARSADSIFEFGSGFGYSATWFLNGLSPRGEIVLTERDPENLARAASYLERAGEHDRVGFEEGDALEIVERYDGPFDVVLLDHDKADYLAAFERVTDKVPVGGVVLADNILHGPVWYEDILPYLREGDGEPSDEPAAGLLAYLRRIRAAPDFLTIVVPIGNGVAATTRIS